MMKSSRSVLAAVLCLGVGACDGVHETPPATASATPEEAQPIIGGETDTGDPSVVAVYAQQVGATSGFLCTGSVIAPTVVLTAAHCVSASETGANARFVVLTASNINRPGGQQLAVKEVHANPRWSAKNLQNGHDQGIVILAQPTTLAPLPFNAHALAASSTGASLRIVGYGLDDGVDQTGAGVKRQALTKLGSVEDTLIEVGNSQKGTCNGDSGGPAFMKLGGVETIVGTTSYGDETCSDGGYDARVDTDLDFIQPFLDGASCTPACSGRACGSDGCGGTCGMCDDGSACSDAGKCVASASACDGSGAEQEPNDSALEANALCAGGIKGKLASPTDQDWFSFTVAADATYDAKLAGGPSGATLRVYKLGSTGHLSFIGDGAGASPEVSRHTDDGGTYVARVTGGAQSSATYTLTATTTPGS
ncbi:MAG TPA: trypsin-like serine protease [Polyangia bacterium]|jgi:V8-like Glu-specific endopeptidase|nr:trypsin-like serine protease [Polyangia bacterium]